MRWLLLLAALLAALLFLGPPWAPLEPLRERLPGRSSLSLPSQLPWRVPPGDAALARLVAAQPVSIAALRAGEYPGSDLTVERALAPGRGFSRQVVSYRSEGLKIYGLLTVPDGERPGGGWPAVVMNHGYIPPDVYRTTERYVRYQAALAESGFVTLKPDYRGHGDSEGEALGGYNHPGYTVDVLNAVASLRRDPRVNGDRIGLWGHSMGGQLSLRAMLVDDRLRAASLWAGVVASYDVLATQWGDAARQAPELRALDRRFMRLLSPNAHLEELRGRPLQLHHGTADAEVPYAFQEALAADLREAGQGFFAYRYEGDDHNIGQNLETALARDVAFFREYLE